MDECTSSSCDAASTKCSNTDGGFYCKCRTGFEPNMGMLFLWLYASEAINYLAYSKWLIFKTF